MLSVWLQFYSASELLFWQILLIGLKPSLKVWMTFPYGKVQYTLSFSLSLFMRVCLTVFPAAIDTASKRETYNLCIVFPLLNCKCNVQFHTFKDLIVPNITQTWSHCHHAYFKGLVKPKIKILSFIYCDVIPNSLDFHSTFVQIIYTQIMFIFLCYWCYCKWSISLRNTSQYGSKVGLTFRFSLSTNRFILTKFRCQCMISATSFYITTFFM